tara:strand:+ start:6440 stop:6856 length:417 start_codon:yes stop_codon:yes gene_type:complete
MAATVYFNNTNELNSLWYDSHASVVKRVCMELGQTDNMNDVVEKILGPRPKVKKMKDPNKPKKAKTAFMFYCDAHRPALMKAQKQEKGKINIGEIAKALGKKWKALSDKDKKPFNTKAAKSKVEQEKAMKVYQESLGL